MRGKSFGIAASPVQRVGAPGGGLASFRRIVAAQVGGSVSGPQTLTAPVSGTYRLAIVGAGGQGAASGYTGQVALSGGGSGGVAVSKAFPLSAGQTISVNIGAAGTPQSGGLSYGQNGGPTTATLPDGSTMTANGGLGGAGTTSGGVLVPGGAGGSASGGEYNSPGTAGGSAQVAGSSRFVNPPGQEAFSVSGAGVTTGNPVAAGTTITNTNVAVAAGATSATGGFCPALLGSNGTVGSFSDVINAGAGGGAYYLNNGNNGVAGGRAGHGGAYLILEA